VKASIDSATAKDNENVQLRAKLQKAEECNNELQSELRGTKWRVDHWYKRYLKQFGSTKRLEEANTALHKQLSQMAEREKAALKKLDELKECLRQPDKEVEA
jgi:hypothetical protein